MREFGTDNCNRRRCGRIWAQSRRLTVDNGQMTPSLKIRCHKIREAYGDAPARLYERGG